MQIKTTLRLHLTPVRIASLSIKEMQNKTTLRLHLTPVRIAIIKNTTNIRCWGGCGEKKYPCTLLVGMQASATTLQNNLEAS
jgi:hypothetical protein